MSILVSGIRLPIGEDNEAAVEIALRRIGRSRGEGKAGIAKLSFDARRGKVSKVVTIAVDLPEGEAELVAALGQSDVSLRAGRYVPLVTGTKKLTGPPVIIGFGPAGIFSALMLAQHGYCPIVLERGPAMNARDRAVGRFFSERALDVNANVQFGEGGAGAYSDGKLTTRIHDPRCDFVLRTFHAFGAPEDILYRSRPHIGTDFLKRVIVAMRKEIIRLGGRIYFGAQVSDLELKNGALRALVTNQGRFSCDAAVLAVGHSARDTFEMLHAHGIAMEQKPFSIGVRIEHLQAEIDKAVYKNDAGHPALPPAEYTLSVKAGERGCYSFCMCPGGVVVPAVSEYETMTVNGMSNYKRDGKTANAALAVSVYPSDFSTGHPLAGISFQRMWEKAAFHVGGGDYAAPVCTLGDFLGERRPQKLGGIAPTVATGFRLAALQACLPDFVTAALRQAIPQFARSLPGFDAPDAVLTAPKTRTSSPVRIPRCKETMHSVSLKGLIPCGEGAGYAGGIMSASVDGIRAAQSIMSTYAPIQA